VLSAGCPSRDLLNLFGHLRYHPHVLVEWLQLLGIDAVEVTGVEIEWAPPKAEHFDGGSAIDALITYRSTAGFDGFVGVESKHAEDLCEQRIEPRQTYIDFTLASGQAGRGRSTTEGFFEKRTTKLHSEDPDAAVVTNR
jgi:hypothetical protein